MPELCETVALLYKMGGSLAMALGCLYSRIPYLSLREILDTRSHFFQPVQGRGFAEVQNVSYITETQLQP